MTMDVHQLQAKLREHQSAMFQQVRFLFLLPFTPIFLRFFIATVHSSLRSNISQHDVAVGPHVCFLLYHSQVIFRPQNLTLPFLLPIIKKIKILIIIIIILITNPF